MSNKTCRPTLTCGKVFDVNLPTELTMNDPPIDLADVTVNVGNLKKPCVQFNYSQIIGFKTFGVDPSLNIVYRLIRTDNKTDETTLLEEWNLRGSEVFPTTTPEIDTIEPLVLNFCECFSNKSVKRLTYTLQLVEVTTTNSTYNITNEEISAISICGTSES